LAGLGHLRGAVGGEPEQRPDLGVGLHLQIRTQALALEEGVHLFGISGGVGGRQVPGAEQAVPRGALPGAHVGAPEAVAARVADAEGGLLPVARGVDARRVGRQRPARLDDAVAVLG
ncbi:MAG: hypothetical protein ACK55I_39510, partial [bacterium]